MKFADKLFLSMTVLLAVMFSLFGIWMLTSDFSQLLDREFEQGIKESRMFDFLFEMGYQSTEEFGEEYAIGRTLGSIADSVERDGSHMFVAQGDGSVIYGGDHLNSLEFTREADKLIRSLGSKTYGCCVRQIDGGYYMLTVTVTNAASDSLYLGLCRDLTSI